MDSDYFAPQDCECPMKKILLLSALLGFVLHTTVTAQTFEAQAGDTATAAYFSGTSLKVNNRLRSTGTGNVKVRWKVVNSSFGTGWNLVGLCDNVTCYPPSTTLDGTWKVTDTIDNNYSNSATTPINPDENDFHVEFDNMAAVPNGTSSFLRVQVQDNAATSNEKFLTFVATKGTTGVVSVTRSEDNVVLFPNPARDHVNVLFSAEAGVKNIALYNLIGKPVMVYRVQDNNSAKLELNNVASGVYFLRLMNSQGNVIATRRFTHQ